MSETAIAWMVVSGAYSDYTVHAVFTDKALVDAYVEMCAAAGSPAEIEEIPLNPEADVLRERQLTWHVQMDWNGDNAEVRQFPPMLVKPSEPHRWWHPASNWAGMRSHGRWETWIVARSADHALKAVNEQRLIAISEGVPQEWDAYFAWLSAARRVVHRTPNLNDLGLSVSDTPSEIL